MLERNNILYAEGVVHHSPGLPRFFSGYPGRVECVLAAVPAAQGSRYAASLGYDTQRLRRKERCRRARRQA